MLIYVPLERMDSRYTVHLDNDIITYLNSNNIDYIRIYPNINFTGLKKGHFLNSSFTTKFKSLQLAEIADLYECNKINDDTTFFFSDLWFPGIEAIAYMNYFYNVNPKIKGIIHAGSFTDTDYVRNLERWAKNFEDIIFDISDTIFVGSDFIKNDILKKRIVNHNKIKTTYFPLDFSTLDSYKVNNIKENIVIFNGRLCDEKQPWLFDELKLKFKNKFAFIKTQELNLCKLDYYSLLSKSKVVVSFALQENFGFGINEATYLGCIPLLPNRLVYNEIYDSYHLYSSFEECCAKLELIHQGTMNEIITKIPIKNQINTLNLWFK